jgi:hypothetical protein
VKPNSPNLKIDGDKETARPRRRSKRHHALVLWVAGVLQACVLVLTSGAQIYDTNFNTLAETPGLLAGDHPYRDFFDWGVPLQAALSATMQWVVGYRLIGEFALQWAFIAAGLVMAMRIGLRLSNSLVASSICILLAILIFPGVPTVHYSKMFIYPAAILIIWRYIEHPSVQRAAAMGAFAAIAFFFRHDHGVYVGAGVVLGVMLAWLAHAGDRRRAIIRELTACALAAGIIVAPWAAVVARSEGLIDYVQARAFINSKWSVRQPVFLQVLHMNPRPVLTPRDPGGPGIAAWLPTKTAAQDWLMQISLVVVIISLTIAFVAVLRALLRRQSVSVDTCRLLLASTVVAVVESRLFREAGYFALVFPLVAALSARLLVSSGMVLLTRTVGGVLLLISTIAVGGFSGVWLNPGDLLHSLPGTVDQLMASPPLDGLEPLRDALRVDRTDWLQSVDWERVNSARSNVMFRYMRECAAPGDRILVSGQTPYQVSYYVERPLAGGHLYWHDKWRSDPERERQSLDLLQHQSVPFAFSTHDPVLDDLNAYPRIRAYIQANYAELEGSYGHLLVDRRRTPVHAFGALGLPCFR